jgi:hypothetical protein
LEKERRGFNLEHALFNLNCLFSWQEIEISLSDAPVSTGNIAFLNWKQCFFLQ